MICVLLSYTAILISARHESLCVPFERPVQQQMHCSHATNGLAIVSAMHAMVRHTPDKICSYYLLVGHLLGSFWSVCSYDCSDSPVVGLREILLDLPTALSIRAFKTTSMERWEGYEPSRLALQPF